MVKTLLISDKMYRSFDPAKREQYVSLIRFVKKNGADVHHLSSAHPPGKLLDDMTGIGAILAYRVEGIE